MIANVMIPEVNTQHSLENLQLFPSIANRDHDLLRWYFFSLSYFFKIDNILDTMLWLLEYSLGTF